ncbi:MAG: UvrD-helicase domain-containing protein, partial [Candidatus Eisenbacteria bacterium]
MRTYDGTLDREHRDLARGLGGGLDFTAIVEAGAGTGKTSVLVDRLLALVRSGTSVPRIVAITFTEKAAGELRVRFRTSIEDAITESAPADGPLLEAALREIDRANVGTIHGFCARLLRERPVEASVDPDFAVADELRRTVLLESSWDSWIRSELRAGLPQAAADAHFLGIGLSAIRELAFRLVNDRDALELLPETTDPGDVAAFVEDLERESREIRAAFGDCEDTSDRAAEAIERFAAEVESLEFLPSDLKEPFALRRVRPEPGSRTGRQGNWKEGVLDELRERAGRLRDAQESLRSRASHNTSVALLTWLEGFLEEYERQKEAAGLLDFQDLLSKTRDLLKNDRPSRQYFKRSFDRILVDEFQDTDPLQCEIAFFLAESDDTFSDEWTDVELEPGKLFIVGDPKQSIYRFRRADIETYELAKEIIGRSGRILTLSENFRTRPSIVGCVNDSFSRTMVAPEGGHAYQPQYEALAPHRPDDESGPGVVLLRPAEPIGGKGLADEVRQAEAATVAAYIASLLEAGRPLVYDRHADEWRPPRLGDVAVLFHRLTGLPYYEDAFNTYGLDYRIAGGKRFYVRREVSELSTVLSAIDDPNDLMSVLGALRTPFMGVSDDDIVVHRHRTGGLRYLEPPGGGVPAVEDAFRILRALHHERNSLSVAALVSRLFDETGALELFLLKPTGEQRHANLQKVVELATALERQSPMSFGGFVRWLRDVSQLTPEEAESPLAEEGDQFLRVLTIHKSKGLEFPITVLADLGRHKQRFGNLVVDRESGTVEYGKGKDAERLETLGFEGARELESLRASAETLRLLYVGMTRARDAVVIPWFSPDVAKSHGLLDHLTDLSEVADDPGDRRAEWVSAGSLDLTVRPVRPVRLPVADVLDADPSDTPAARELSAWSESLARFAPEHHRPPSIVTPSSLAHEAAGTERAWTALVDRDALGVTRSGGVELGSLVHSVMERVALRRGGKTPVGDDEGASGEGDVASLASAAARASGVSEATAAEAATMVSRALDSSVVRRASGASRCYREVPFSMVRGETIVEGKMDMVFVEDGELVVV